MVYVWAIIVQACCPLLSYSIQVKTSNDSNIIGVARISNRSVAYRRIHFDCVFVLNVLLVHMYNSYDIGSVHID